ncbi:SDR family NAD(P)-dependent oxidoreductase [Frigidibacter sp. RF13]|uniref:SDR family NAD(P)-dependent oxidoreductase n=1 Tax=Frigidibacter sp. RF13 TaxID=2997340 RepID=UPI0022706CEB|nr:SDR family NAD(P)-dependent oxidoreductase [Frigidibacter sp. RF13]MCY1126836.1 SDR family NAD(P)-dependent oxidoreductase [Frigidibacter sp. RF13]
MTGHYRNRKILVTGASRGIGRELTLQLLAAGASVIAVSRETKGIAATEPDHIHPIACDLADPADVARLVERVAQDHADLSVLINNAGVMVHTDLTDPPPDRRGEVLPEIATNLTAPILLSVGLLPTLAANPGAAICNVTSGIAIAPVPDAAVYAATKAGLRHFTRALRYQVEDAGLRVQVSECVMTLVATGLSRDGGRRRYPPERAAADLLAGLAAGRREIWIEKAKLLRLLVRLSPALANRVMRGR